MNWTMAIERNRGALLRVVAMLCAIVGIDAGMAVRTLPRGLHRHVLRMLRPAESAIRRLVVIVARDVTLPQPVTTNATTGATSATTRAIREMNGRDDRRGAGRVAFALLDPLLDPTCVRPRRAKSFPRICCPGFTEPAPLPRAPMPYDPLDAARLCGRIAALRRALDDLPGHALRLARLSARIAARRIRRRNVILRPGRPPGHRRRPAFEIDEILAECHALAVLVQIPPPLPPVNHSN